MMLDNCFLSAGSHLYNAIEVGNEAEVTQLLSSLSIPNFEDIKKDSDTPSQSPLLLAMSFPGIFKKLLEAYGSGGKIPVSIKGETLRYASQNGYAEIVKLLLKQWTDIGNGDKSWALSNAAYSGYTEIVDFLLQQCGANISNHDKGYTLNIASYRGYTEIVRLLLNKWHMGIRNSDKGLALRSAVDNGYTDIVVFLLQQCGANISNDDKGYALRSAVQNGHAEITTLLFRQWHMYISNEHKNFVLKYAASNGYTEIVDFLLQQYSANISNDDKGWALKYAAENGHAKIIGLLLRADTSNEYKGLVLKYAVSNGYTEIVAFLLQQYGANIRNDDKGYALRSAVEKGYAEITTLLFKQWHMYLSNEYKSFVLKHAVNNGHTEIIRLFLQTDVSNECKGFILKYAVSNGYTEIVEFLLQQYSASISSNDKDYALKYAAKNGHTEIISLFLRADISNEDKVFVLKYAVSNGYAEVVAFLLQTYSANIGNNDKEWAITSATQSGYTEIVDFLLQEYGANIDNEDKGFVLQYAAQSGHAKNVTFLLQQYSANISNEDKSIALVKAAQSGHTEIVAFLLQQYDSDIDSDYKGWALSSASENGHTEIVRLLLQQCCDDISNDDKSDALHFAVSDGCFEIVNELLMYESVIAVAHHGNNQILREAQMQLNGAEGEEAARYQAIIDRLMQIPAVAELARQQVNRETDLADITRFAENSMQSLTQNEKALIKHLKEHYKTVFEDKTWDQIRAEILSYLEHEYEKHPAIDGYHYVWMLENNSDIPTGFIPADTIGIQPQGEKAILSWINADNVLQTKTVLMSEVEACYHELSKGNWLYQNAQDDGLVGKIVDKFGITPHPHQGKVCPLNYAENQNQSRLVAYYRHSAHTAWRYLSDTNPWMSPGARFIETLEDGRRRAIMGDPDKEQTSYYWIALNDETVQLEPGFSIKGNKNSFIEVIALLNRGHNADERAFYVKDLHRDIREPGIKKTTADDLKADAPSCSYGVLKRLLQSQYGHPYLNAPEAKPLSLQIILDRMTEQLIRTKEEGSEFNNLIDKLNNCENKNILNFINQQIEEICWFDGEDEKIMLTEEEKNQYDSIFSFPDEQLQNFMTRTMRWFGQERIENQDDNKLKLPGDATEFLRKEHASYKDFIEYCAKNALNAFTITIRDAVEQRLEALKPQPILNAYQGEVGQKRKRSEEHDADDRARKQPRL